MRIEPNIPSITIFHLIVAYSGNFLSSILDNVVEFLFIWALRIASSLLSIRKALI